MIFRALFVSALTAWSIYASPIILPPPPSKSAPSVAEVHFDVKSWGLEMEGRIQHSRHSPSWWRRQFEQEHHLLGKTAHFTSLPENNPDYHDTGAVIYRKTEGKHQTETLIPTLHNETIRHSYVFNKFGKPHKPSWWPKEFEFHGATKIGQNETAYGRIVNNLNLVDLLPKKGRPWVKIGEEFYIGHHRNWWAYAQNGELRIFYFDQHIER